MVYMNVVMHIYDLSYAYPYSSTSIVYTNSYILKIKLSHIKTSSKNRNNLYY